MTIRRMGATAALGLTAMLMVVTAAARADATSEWIPVSFVTNSFCGTSEVIAVEGDMHVVYAFTSQGDGVYHEQQIAQAHLVGYGLESGDMYIFDASGHIVGNYPPNGRSLVLESDHSVQIHAGETTPLDDFYMRVSFNTGGYSIDVSGCR